MLLIRLLTGYLYPLYFRYHVPRSFLKPTGNLLVLIEEETGVDPVKISLDRISVAKVCALVSETHLHPVSTWMYQRTSGNLNNTRQNPGRKPTAKLRCPPNSYISKILYASYGNPSGDCKTYAAGSCHSEDSTAVVQKVSSCAFTIVILKLCVVNF